LIAGRRLKVAFASHSSSMTGGAERSLLDIAVALRQDGRVDPVVTVPAAGSLSAALRAGSIVTVELPAPWWTWRPVGPDDSRPSTGALLLDSLRRGRAVTATARAAAPWLRWLRAERPDVVVTNTAVTPAPAFACALAAVPHIWWIHEFVTKDHGLSYVLGEAVSQRLIGSLSKLVVANSGAVQNYYSPPIQRGKIRLVYQGVRTPVAGRNALNPTGLRALLLGRLTPAKGVSQAIEAVGILNREGIPVFLRLVGPIQTEYKLELERLAARLGCAGNMEIAGPTATPETEYARANVVLMCSASEAFGRVTLEALKCGRPVVGTRSGGTPELISDGTNGFLFSPGNVSELASALGRLARDAGLLDYMARNASASIEGRFTLEEEAEALVAAFEAVLR